VGNDEGVNGHGTDRRQLREGADGRALTDLLAHRRKVLEQLQAVSGINPESAANAIQEELAVIEAGLEELKPPSGSLPENEWN
jgi:inorganic triphosphatase YgiF